MYKNNSSETRLHSSKMHTTHLLTVSPSMHCTGGCLLWGVSAVGGAWSGGWAIPACTEADPPPCEQND